MEEQINRIREADMNAEGSYVGTFGRAEALGPERALQLAVLEDAIHCFRRHSTARSGAGRRQFLETERWIMAQREDRIFGFENICETLGLDPGYLRRGLVQWKLQAVGAVSAPSARLSRKRAA